MKQNKEKPQQTNKQTKGDAVSGCVVKSLKASVSLSCSSSRSTWDDHLFEIVLPKPCCVGHVDLKFTLHPLCTTAPNIEVKFLPPPFSVFGWTLLGMMMSWHSASVLWKCHQLCSRWALLFVIIAFVGLWGWWAVTDCPYRWRSFAHCCWLIYPGVEFLCHAWVSGDLAEAEHWQHGAPYTDFCRQGSQSGQKRGWRQGERQLRTGKFCCNSSQTDFVDFEEFYSLLAFVQNK